MKRVTAPLLLLLTAATAAAAPGPLAHPPARATAKVAKPAPSPAAKVVRKPAAGRSLPAAAAVKGKSDARIRPAPVARNTAAPGDDEAPAPGENDPDRERVQRLQEALYSIVHGPVLGRLRVGVRAMDTGSGRVLFGRGGSALMDPASNQKVLATTTALLRLGSDWQFRT